METFWRAENFQNGLAPELKTKIARPLPNGKGHGQIMEEFVPLQHFNGPGSFEGLAPLRTPAPILSATCPDTQVPSYHVLTQLLACQLGGLGSALRLPMKLECSVTITKTHKFPTQKLLLDRELGGLLFTP